MKKIEAIIRPMRLEAVKSGLADAGASGMTVTDVRGSGRSGGHPPSTFRGEEYLIRLPPKTKLELMVRDEDVEEIVRVLLEKAQTGEEGDGWIYVLPAGQALRIRTGETGEGVL